MKAEQFRLFFIIIILSTCVVMFFSLWDIYHDQHWLQSVLALYVIMAILTFVLIFLRLNEKKIDVKQTIVEFRDVSEDKLRHFKCPNCSKIFSIDESKIDNNKPYTLTCPECGNTGKISSKPVLMVEKIPGQ